jgi:hypothetical protein
LFCFFNNTFKHHKTITVTTNNNKTTAMDSTSESDRSGSGSTISDTTDGVHNGKETAQKPKAPLEEKNKEANKEDNKVLSFLLFNQ